MLMGILTGPGFRFPVCLIGICGANTSCIWIDCDLNRSFVGIYCDCFI